MKDKDNKISAELEARKRDSGTVKLNKDKRARVPLAEQQSLTFFDKEPDRHYRWVSDTYGRIDKFLLAGWRVEVGDVTATYSGKGRKEAEQTGSVIKRIVNKDPLASHKEDILMSIEEELFQEDQKKKDNKILAEEARKDPDGLIKRARHFGGIESRKKLNI